MGDIKRKDIVRRRINILATAVLCMLLIVTGLFCVIQVKAVIDKPDTEEMRSQIQLLAAGIEKKWANGKQVEADASLFAYAIIENDGSVLFSSIDKISGHLNLHILDSMNSGYYCVPLLTNGVQTATLCVATDRDYFGIDTGRVWLYIIISAVIILTGSIIYLMLMSTLKKDIFDPVGKLHTATRNILGGRLDTPVGYDYDGETGTLCHDFELMRTELSDSMKREQKLKEDEKLLMASISHDLKTPLATVQGYLESICLGVVTQEEDVKHYCRSALDKTILLGRMTNDILEHSKAELRQLSIEREEVYSREYFIPLLTELQSDALCHGYKLTFGEVPNVLISLDRIRIAQVCENIVGNSIKYGKERINITFYLEDKAFHVIISDDGQGIEAMDLPFVFDRFYRGDKARTQSIPGSGLGLSIARYIVEQHGGRIECDSVVGQGTKMEFTIML